MLVLLCLECRLLKGLGAGSVVVGVQVIVRLGCWLCSGWTAEYCMVMVLALLCFE